MLRRSVRWLLGGIFAMGCVYLLGIFAWYCLYLVDSWEDEANVKVTYPISLAAISKFDRDVYIVDFVGANDCYPGGNLLKGSEKHASFGRSKSLIRKVKIIWKTKDDQKAYEQWVDLPVISMGLQGEFEFILSPEGQWDCKFAESGK